ncbi:MAG: hypothetical protein BGO30_01300 [Bacteroidetes bacterium 41-46]|nr:MAG: hypothetical protein BGO30_01300 [Bacteroidetes bacterium 41-46]
MQKRELSFMCKLLFVAAIITVSTTIAFGQQRLVTTSATAVLRKPVSLTITKNSDLIFGTIAPGISPGSVTISHSNNTVSSNGVSLLSVGPLRNRAAFTIRGPLGTPFSVSIPSSIQLISGGLAPMNLNLTKNLPNTNNSIPVGGSIVLYIGGTLQINSNQPTGNYTGSMTVTINYN